MDGEVGEGWSLFATRYSEVIYSIIATNKYYVFTKTDLRAARSE